MRAGGRGGTDAYPCLLLRAVAMAAVSVIFALYFAIRIKLSM